MLSTEFNKTRRNLEVVSGLMDKTFALRRKAILETSMDLNTMFKQYPFLQEIDQVGNVLLNTTHILCFVCVLY